MTVNYTTEDREYLWNITYNKRNNNKVPTVHLRAFLFTRYLWNITYNKKQNTNCTFKGISLYCLSLPQKSKTHAS